VKRYNPKDIEPKWQEQWTASNIYEAKDFDTSRPKYVMLTEFPYPSGDGLHLGHVREYTLGDIMARYKRMNGYNVLFPMGYDAFGLPTENYAIKNGIAPQVATERNVANFQQQFNSLGFSIDWSRAFRTTDPDYYKWTQWLFLQFYKKGLAYQDKIAINWCPKCKTGLANEEVSNGRHERCDTLVEKRELKQWLLKITQYADRLIDGLADLDYPSRIADQQINWIGRSKGAEIDFAIDGSDKRLKVFTTRPDTLFGVTFMVVAPEHELLDEITTDDQKAAVHSYIKQTQAKSEIERQDTSREKTGVFTGAHAINPANGDKIPVWVADYVLGGYGTGAIMAVPAHDERDGDFAKKYELPIVRVVQNDASDNEATHEEGIMVNSGAYDGMSSSEARERIVADLQKEGKAKERINYKLRDWIFSRQHYWGEPIPIIHCDEHGAVAVPDDQLPVTLPKVDKYEPTDTGESPLAAIDSWVNTTCPVCGKPAKRETDTMPNWAGSSWYYLRFFDAHNDQRFADPEKLKYWGEVDMYLGGMEHTTLHLLYSRFWHQFFYDLGLVPTPEPYRARRGQGIILAADGSKMSKSKGNVINPNTILDQGYGADALRLAIAFLAPYDQTTPWSPEGVAGTFRFVQRIWTLVREFMESDAKNATDQAITEDIMRAVHVAIKRVTFGLEQMSFNTAVAALMECVNELYKCKAKDNYANRDAWKFALESLVQLVAPYAPHAAEELWREFGHDTSIHVSQWPRYDEKYLTQDVMQIVVQVNGKVRSRIELPTGAPEAAVLDAVKVDEKTAAFIDGKAIKKSIYVPGKLVNIVV
jgi:leucyl-tRNA synthetase